MDRKVIGLRREDKHQWERRVPLTPAAVATLVDQEGFGCVVQPSAIRVFSDQDYERAGADVREDLSSCDVLFAVKEIPRELFRAGGAYVFFSHTIKAQAYNMPMLRRLRELGCTLIDYERITDDDGGRLVFFGPHAGMAGMIDTLWAAGRRLAALGWETPLAEVKLAHEYTALGEAQAGIAAVGARLRGEPLPRELAPFICGFTGYGNVSQGAQQVFDLLPTEIIEPDELARVTSARNPPRDRVFKVVFHERDMVEQRDGGEFDLEEYYQHPARYRGVFSQHLPHLTVLVNAIYWTDAYPRLVTKDFLREWFAGLGDARLVAIGDISCDLDGAVQCTTKSTTPGAPVYVYDPATEAITDGWQGEGVVVMATDCLPCELPKEASESFTAALAPFVPAIAKANYDLPYGELDLPAPVKRGLILLRGELTPEYEYLREYLQRPRR